MCGKADTQVEQQDSEDDGPPPGWDSKCEPEPKVQEACPSNPRSGHLVSFHQSFYNPWIRLWVFYFNERRFMSTEVILVS